jgi:6 kDa early secretory antigenic target
MTGMSGSPFQVDHATLHTAANDVRSTRSEVDGQLKALSGVVEELGAAWQGQAAGGFQRLMAGWNGDVTKLLQAMDSIADLLDKSGTQHQVNEEHQDQMFNKFNSALNP